jgi:hypothetical protein
LKLKNLNKVFLKNDFGFSITCVKFLNTRIYGNDATLVSCGGNGFVRFWDVPNGKLVAEFVAHENGKFFINFTLYSKLYLIDCFEFSTSGIQYIIYTDALYG